MRLSQFSSEEIDSSNLLFPQLRDQIDTIARRLEPWITKRYKFKDDEERPSKWLRQTHRFLKGNMCMKRIIDHYLVNFQKIDSTSLVSSSLNSSMLHKRRVYALSSHHMDNILKSKVGR